MPRQHFVELETLPGGVQNLVHKATLERKALPPGTWQLEFSPNGKAGVFEIESGDTIMVDDFLDQVLCEDNCGNVFVLQRATGLQGPRTDLCKKEMEFRQITVELTTLGVKGVVAQPCFLL